MEEAQWILAQCTRFGCLPSQLMAEDADLMRLLRLEDLAGSEGGEFVE